MLGGVKLEGEAIAQPFKNPMLEQAEFEKQSLENKKAELEDKRKICQDFSDNVTRKEQEIQNQDHQLCDIMGEIENYYVSQSEDPTDGIVGFWLAKAHGYLVSVTGGDGLLEKAKQSAGEIIEKLSSDISYLETQISSRKSDIEKLTDVQYQVTNDKDSKNNIEIAQRYIDTKRRDPNKIHTGW